VIEFIQPVRFSPAGAGVAVPFPFYYHLPFVHGSIDRLPAAFDIDTGSRAELTVTGPTVADDHLRDRYTRGVSNVTGWGAGGPTHAFVVRLHSVTLGQVRVDGPAANLSQDHAGSLSDPNYQGNIGSALLRRFVITFDYGRQVLYMRRIEPPPQALGNMIGPAHCSNHVRRVRCCS